MRNTYTIKPTSQRSMHIICRIFGIFSSSINKILLDAQIKEYNTKLSKNPNTCDDSNNKRHALLTVPHLPNNHPLSLVSQNFLNLAITKPPKHKTQPPTKPHPTYSDTTPAN